MVSIARIPVLVKASNGQEHIIYLRVECATGRITEVESQSQPGGYLWRGEAAHECDSRLHVCRHMQAVRQYQAQAQAQQRQQLQAAAATPPKVRWTAEGVL